MRGVIFLFLLIAPGMADAASIVKFGARLCDEGQHMSAGTCTDKVQNECPAGYYETLIAPSTYSAITIHNQCMNSYNKVELPTGFNAIYNGVLIKFGPTLCGADQQLANGKCEPKEQGRCADGSYKTLVVQSTFSAPGVSSNECMNSYNMYELDSVLSLIYNGVLISFGPKLCGAGQYLADGECMPTTRGECPENFHVISPDEATLGTLGGDGACANGYAGYYLNANCAAGETSDNMCAVLCDAGLQYTGLGTCAAPCPHGMTAMHLSDGHSWPMYAEKLTTPGLNIKMPAGMCYINFLPGAARGGVNVKSADGTYHITD